MCNGKEEIKLTPAQIVDVSDIVFLGLLKVKNGKKKKANKTSEEKQGKEVRGKKEVVF